ncbi:hypothetical protein HY024_03190 [Candidatus Curtissbacteria bacterium]|nr:hypothetical protein [Candidatus Curtissbacteria bacterium]
MKFIVDQKIFEKWSDVIIGGLVLSDFNNKGSNQDLLKLLRDQEAKTQQALASLEMGQVPEVAAWRQAHRDFGSDPRDFPSSIESLLRRARGGKPLPQINKLVDLYNYMSLKYYVPAGAEDADKIKGNVQLAFATGTESGMYLGSDTVENCQEGEVIYKDDEGFICRRWNWREADRTKIDENTKNALLVFEAIPPTNREKLETIIKEAADLSAKFVGGTQTSFILDKNNPEL